MKYQGCKDFRSVRLLRLLGHQVWNGSGIDLLIRSFSSLYTNFFDELGKKAFLFPKIFKNGSGNFSEGWFVKFVLKWFSDLFWFSNFSDSSFLLDLFLSSLRFHSSKSKICLIRCWFIKAFNLQTRAEISFLSLYSLFVEFLIGRRDVVDFVIKWDEFWAAQFHWMDFYYSTRKWFWWSQCENWTSVCITVANHFIHCRNMFWRTMMLSVQCSLN